MFNILLIVLGVLSALYYFTTRKYNYWKKRNVPHLPPVPIFGNYANTILQRKTLGEVVKEICEKFPDAPVVGAYYGTEPVLIPRDLEVIKTILTKDFYYFNGREVSEYAPMEKDGHSLFTSYGDFWKVLRQNLTPLFSSAKMKNMFKMIADSAHELENLLDEKSKLGPVDVRNLMDRFTMQCIGACVFGIQTKTIETGENNPFKQIGNNVLKPSRLLAFKFALRAIWPSIFYALKLALVGKEAEKFSQIIQAVFKDRESRPTNTPDFVNMLIKWKDQHNIEGDKLRPAHSAEHGKAAISVTDDLVRAQCVGFFAGGFETSATTLTHTLYELAKNERAQEKVREEVDAFFQRHNNEITYDCLSELPYLDACFDETLRKYPVLGCVTREVIHDYTLSPGIKLDKGLRVHIPVQYIHNNPDFFPDPEEYRPERFYEEEKNNAVPYSFMPFGEGPRICIGMRFAKMQMMAGIITVLRSYKLELAENVPNKLTFMPESLVPATIDNIHLKLIKRH